MTFINCLIDPRICMEIFEPFHFFPVFVTHLVLFHLLYQKGPVMSSSSVSTVFFLLSSFTTEHFLHSSCREDMVFPIYCVLPSPSPWTYDLETNFHPPRTSSPLRWLCQVALAGLVIPSQMLPKHFVHGKLFIVFLSICI